MWAFLRLEEVIGENVTDTFKRCTSHGFHETCHSVTFYFMTKDSKQYCDTTAPESIHTKDESFHLWCELTSTMIVTE